MNPVAELSRLLAPLFALLGEHPLLRAGVVLLIALIAALIIDRIAMRLLKRLTSKTKSEIDDQIIEQVSGPLFQSILMLGVAAAINLLHIEQGIKVLLFSVMQSYAVLLWGLFLMRLARIVLRRMAISPNRFAVVRTQTLPLFENIALVLILGLAIYLVFTAWHIDMTAWLASAGIIGIAVGFAAKDTLANLFSGVFILADAPYKIGDFIVLDSGERGQVTHIGIRSTRLLTRDDVEITIPNSIIGNTKISNESGGPYTKYRIRVDVGVAYGSDVDQVRGILMEIATAEPSVCADPEPRVRFRNFGASSLDFQLLAWIEEPVLRGRVIDVLLTTIYKRFLQEGIEIPFQKHDLYIKELPRDGQ